MSYWAGAEGPINGPKGPQPSAGTRNKRAKCAKRAVFLVNNILLHTALFRKLPVLSNPDFWDENREKALQVTLINDTM